MTAPTAIKMMLTPRPMTYLLDRPLGGSCEQTDQRQKRSHDQHEEEELRDREPTNDSEQHEQDNESQQRHLLPPFRPRGTLDRKSTRLNSSHSQISYAVFCL